MDFSEIPIIVMPWRVEEAVRTVAPASLKYLMGKSIVLPTLGPLVASISSIIWVPEGIEPVRVILRVFEEKVDVRVPEYGEMVKEAGVTDVKSVGKPIVIGLLVSHLNMFLNLMVKVQAVER